MITVLRKLWNDDAGFIVSSELVLVSTIGVLGMTAGLAEISSNVNGEMQDVGSAIRQLDQSRFCRFENSAQGSQQTSVVDFESL